jgi:uncharacterized protein (TIRG00374 family)
MYWALPALLLYVVLTRIDTALLGEVLADANTTLLVTGVAVIIPVVLTGALRWHLLLKAWRCTRSSFAANAVQYWISLVIGFAAPGAVGSDIYRTVVVGRHGGQYVRSATVIAVEKLTALGSCALLIGSIYPFVHHEKLSRTVVIGVDLVYALLAGAAVLILVLGLTTRPGPARDLAARIGNRMDSLSSRFVRSSFARVGMPVAAAQGEAFQAVGARRTALLKAVALSVVAQALAATQAQVFFSALGYQIPYLVNLFVAPMLFALLALPISFGSIGIREAAYILAYGAFGVPAEIALLVSFCGFAAVLISLAIGAVLLWFARRARAKPNVR